MLKQSPASVYIHTHVMKMYIFYAHCDCQCTTQIFITHFLHRFQIYKFYVAFFRQAQIEERAERTWKLRDMLHLGQCGVALDDDGYNAGAIPGPMIPTPSTPPTLVGTAVRAKFRRGRWLRPRKARWTKKPESAPARGQKRHHQASGRKGLALVIQRDVENGVLQWRKPVQYAPSMKLTVPDLQAPQHDPKRLVLITLRAMAKFQGRPCLDYVKVAVEGHSGRVQLFFALCEAFFQDADGVHYVGLRWLDKAGPDEVDEIVRLPRLKLRPSGLRNSYSIMPAASIANGALLIAQGDFYWAVMSPREQAAYERAQA